jgi:hypothetical protein
VKTVAIVQSCYVPWKGYFDLINFADEFILYDDRQFTKHGWRNRNRIKTPAGPQWLTIPVAHRGRHGQRIDETRAVDSRWRVKHWRTLVQNYAHAPHFAELADRFEDAYLAEDETRLSMINRRFIDAICGVLGIETPISSSTAYPAQGAGSQRVLSLCRAAGATRYLSGPTARAYLDESLLAGAGIDVVYMDYSGYPEYPQLHPPFVHEVTVLDLLFNVGAATARRYLKSFDREALAAAG